MQTVEVRFKGNRRGFYDWAVATAPLRLDEPVLVEAERGLDFGRVNAVGDTALAKCGGCTSCEVAPGSGLLATGSGLLAAGESDAAAGSAPPATSSQQPAATSDQPAASSQQPAASSDARPQVIRRAAPRDILQHEELRRNEDEVRRQVAERAQSHKLTMRISDTEWQWDRNRLTIYFTSESRVDFRNLVRELATRFRTRIELRQIGVRDEAARLGGVGRCGREFCCSTWLTTTGPVNLALAKDQRLSLNPAQISGGCGRLLCCLKYEHEFYLASRKRYPKEGKTVVTLRGPEKVIAVDIFRERITLRSDEHGTRIIAALDLRDEIDRAASTPGAPPPSPGAPRA
jgi:cell fate regulator YaaT (PSP1 superfamily)